MTIDGRQDLVGRLIILVGLLLTGESATSLEKPNYTVLYRDGDIEFRQYDPYLVAETIVASSQGYRDAGNEGFRRLFQYISGANSGQAKIAMTAPVARIPSGEKIAMTAPVQQDESAGGWRVTFMLPTQYTMETAPVPTDDRVRISRVPGRLMAVLRYSGRWTDQNFLSKRDELRAVIDAEAIGRIGEFESAAYDPPFMPPFLRRNEVMVEVDRLPASAVQASTGGLTDS
jgi:hypothetical protein